MMKIAFSILTFFFDTTDIDLNSTSRIISSFQNVSANRSIFLLAFQETLRGLFPSWKAVSKRYREVALFTVGLMKDPRLLVDHIYTLYVDDCLSWMRGMGNYPSIDKDLFRSVYSESVVPLPGSHIHNNNINYCDHQKDDKGERPRNKTQIFYPSKFYFTPECNIELQQNKNTELPEYAIIINSSTLEIAKPLLTVCQQISTRQLVSDLYMNDVHCKYWPCQHTPIITLRNPQSVNLDACHLPNSFVRNILLQLSGSGDMLQRLQLTNMFLKPFEQDLDQLLSDLVVHHQRIRGSSWRKLEIELKGIRTILSKRCIRRWKSHCAELESISLKINEKRDCDCSDCDSIYYCFYDICVESCCFGICGCWLLCCSCCC